MRNSAGNRSLNVRRAAAALVAVLILCVGFAAGAAAAPYQLDGLSAGTVEPGGEVTVHANGFLPNSEVSIVLHSDPVLLATTQADSSGVVDVTVTIPLDTPPGTHTIEVIGTGRNGPRTLSFELCVSFCDGEGPGAGGGGSATGSSGGEGGTGALAFTGGSIGMTVGIGAALLVLGVAFIAARRKKGAGVAS